MLKRHISEWMANVAGHGYACFDDVHVTLAILGDQATRKSLLGQGVDVGGIVVKLEALKQSVPPHSKKSFRIEIHETVALKEQSSTMPRIHYWPQGSGPKTKMTVHPIVQKIFDLPEPNPPLVAELEALTLIAKDNESPAGRLLAAYDL